MLSISVPPSRTLYNTTRTAFFHSHDLHHSPDSLLETRPHFVNMASPMTRIAVQPNKSYIPDGPKSYAYALNKYKIIPTQPSKFCWNHDQSKLMKEENGSHGVVVAEDLMNDSFYTCPVQIGTPAQTVDLDFDSGSSDLWVWSSKLDDATLDAGEQQNIKVFDPKKSSTFKTAKSYTWEITYGDGSGASGTVGTDTVKIGNISVEHQAVELATKVSSSFQNQKSSGLLGLGFGNLNTVKPRSAKTPGKLRPFPS